MGVDFSIFCAGIFIKQEILLKSEMWAYSGHFDLYSSQSHVVSGPVCYTHSQKVDYIEARPINKSNLKHK